MNQPVAELRYPTSHGGLLLVTGTLLVLSATLNGHGTVATMGLVVTALGGLFFSRPWVVIQADRVQVVSPLGFTLAEHAVGVDELRVENGRLCGPDGPVPDVDAARVRASDWQALVRRLEQTSS